MLKTVLAFISIPIVMLTAAWIGCQWYKFNAIYLVSIGVPPLITFMLFCVGVFATAGILFHLTTEEDSGGW